MEQKNVNTPPTKIKDAAEKEAHWRKMLEEHEKSGLSQVKFAKLQGISADSLSDWRKRLKFEKKPVKTRAKDEKKIGNKKLESLPKTDKTVAPAVSTSTFELTHSSGFSIVLDSQIDEATLTKLLNCLSRLTKDK